MDVGVPVCAAVATDLLEGGHARPQRVKHGGAEEGLQVGGLRDEHQVRMARHVLTEDGTELLPHCLPEEVHALGVEGCREEWKEEEEMSKLRSCQT